jgi:hypothetical protein
MGVMGGASPAEKEITDLQASLRVLKRNGKVKENKRAVILQIRRKRIGLMSWSYSGKKKAHEGDNRSITHAFMMLSALFSFTSDMDRCCCVELYSICRLLLAADVVC